MAPKTSRTPKLRRGRAWFKQTSVERDRQDCERTWNYQDTYVEEEERLVVAVKAT